MFKLLFLIIVAPKNNLYPLYLDYLTFQLGFNTYDKFLSAIC